MIAWLLDLLFGAYDPLDLESFPRGEGRLHDLTAPWALRPAFWLRDDPAALEHPWLSPERVLRPELPLGMAAMAARRPQEARSALSRG